VEWPHISSGSAENSNSGMGEKVLFFYTKQAQTAVSVRHRKVALFAKSGVFHHLRAAAHKIGRLPP